MSPLPRAQPVLRLATARPRLSLVRPPLPRHCAGLAALDLLGGTTSTSTSTNPRSAFRRDTFDPTVRITDNRGHHPFTTTPAESELAKTRKAYHNQLSTLEKQTLDRINKMQRLPTPEMSAIATNVTNHVQVLRKVIDNVETGIQDVGKVIEKLGKESDKQVTNLEDKQRDNMRVHMRARIDARCTHANYLIGAIWGLTLNEVLFH
jgi:hypothetical protein